MPPITDQLESKKKEKGYKGDRSPFLCLSDTTAREGVSLLQNPRRAKAMSGARPSHDRDPGRKREKERRSERPRKRVKGGHVWLATVTTAVDGESLRWA